MQVMRATTVLANAAIKLLVDTGMEPDVAATKLTETANEGGVQFAMIKNKGQIRDIISKLKGNNNVH